MSGVISIQYSVSPAQAQKFSVRIQGKIHGCGLRDRGAGILIHRVQHGRIPSIADGIVLAPSSPDWLHIYSATTADYAPAESVARFCSLYVQP